MIPLVTAAPAAASASGFVLALTVATSVTAVVAVGIVVLVLHRRHRLNVFVVGISAVSVLSILVSALLVGGSLTRPPAAVADDSPASRGAATAPIETKLSGLQLPTLGLDD